MWAIKAASVRTIMKHLTVFVMIPGFFFFFNLIKAGFVWLGQKGDRSANRYQFLKVLVVMDFPGSVLITPRKCNNDHFVYPVWEERGKACRQTIEVQMSWSVHRSSKFFFFFLEREKNCKQRSWIYNYCFGELALMFIQEISCNESCGYF